MAKSPGVFVVEQDPDARFQLQQLIPETGFSLAGQAGLGTEAVALATEACPEIIVCGIKEPVSRVVQTIESLAHALPRTPIIVYADPGELDMIQRAMLAGARNFLQVPLKPEELRRSLTAALESEERRLLREGGSALLGAHGTIITVFGAKGGVGKTSLAANLAVATVRHAGQSTVLVDADDTFGDAAEMLAVTPERTVMDGLIGLDSLSDNEFKELPAHHDSGLAVLGAPLNPLEWKEIRAEGLRGLLERLARQFDVVVVDTGSNFSDVTQAALDAAALILWVTTPEYASVRDSLQALKAFRMLELPEERVRIVLNATVPEVEVKPSSIEEALGRPIFWTIPYDRQLRRSGQVGRALVEDRGTSPAAKQLIDLALMLSGMPTARQSGNSLLGRLFSGRNGGTLKRESDEFLEEART